MDYVELDYDIGEVETREPPSLVPDGDYVVVVEDAYIADSRASATPTLYVTLGIVEGEYAGTSLRDYMSLRKDAAFRFKQFLHAHLGRAPEGRKVPAPQWYVGRKVIAVVRQQRTENGLRNTVVGYRKVEAKSTPQSDETIDFG